MKVAHDGSQLDQSHIVKTMVALIAVAALAHAVAELIILLVSRAEFLWLDAVVLVAFAAAVDLAGVGLAALAAFVVLGKRRFQSWTADDGVVRRCFVAMVWGAYLGSSLFLLRHVLATMVGAVAFAVVFFVSSAILLTVWTRLSSAGALAAGLLGFALANIGGVGWATLALETSPLAGDSSHLKLVSFFWAFLPATAMLVLLLWRPRFLMRRTARSAIAALSSVLILAAASTAIRQQLGDPASVRWRTTEVRRDSAALPNIVIVVLDTVAARHMELFGHQGPPTMPALTRFARERCDLVTTCLAPAPWTPATHASIFSGTWPHVHGCRRPTPEETDGSIVNPYYCMDMRDDLPTLAEWLSARGYACGAVVGNSILNYYGLPRGFDHVDARTPKYVSWTRHLLFHVPRTRQALMRTPQLLRGNLALFDPLSQEWRRAEQVSRQALLWLRNNDSGPYFLFVNYLDAHTPYKPRSQAARLSRLPGEYLELSNRLWESYHERHEAIPEDLVGGLSALYDETLRELDRAVDGFLGRLSTEPSFGNTLLIITSDHGEEFMEHGDLEHSTNVYEPQVRTPMLIRLPGALRANPPAIGPSFQQVDLFATIAAVVGGDDLPETDGSPWGRGRDYALSEVFANPGFSPRYRLGYCGIETGGYKFIRSSDGTEALYELESDPWETRNVLNARPDLVARFRELADQRDERLVRGGKAADSSGAERLEQLKTLGYVQ